jgi:hypothetical protein
MLTSSASIAAISLTNALSPHSRAHANARTPSAAFDVACMSGNGCIVTRASEIGLGVNAE